MREEQAKAAGEPLAEREYIKHWIGVQLAQKGGVKCLQLSQPDQFAVNELEVFVFGGFVLGVFVWFLLFWGLGLGWFVLWGVLIFCGGVG